MKKCLEKVKIKGEKMVKRLDLTGKSATEIEKIYQKELSKINPKNFFLRIIDVPIDFEAKKIK